MATFGLAGPGRGYVRALRQAHLYANGLPAAHLLRVGLLLLAATHLALILSHMPDSAAGAGYGGLIWIVASAITVIALAAMTSRADAPAIPATDNGGPIPHAPQHAPEVLDLLARLNHDLRTPLNAMIGFSDLMQREMFGPLGNERYQEYARHIYASGDVLLRATEDTLAMTALLAAPPRLGVRDLALGALLADVRAGLGRDGCSAAFVVRETTDAFVSADPEALNQALRHVLRAAVIRADPDASIEIGTHIAAGRVALTVDVGQAGQARFADQPPEAPGLGGEALSLRLARALLALQGIDLAHSASGGRWTARIEMQRAARLS